MKILVCGGRAFGDTATLQRRYPLSYRRHPLWERREAEYDFVFRTLDHAAIEFSQYYRQHEPWKPTDLIIVSGVATGADTAALDWAKDRGSLWKEYPANWEKYGRIAGFIRNQEMLDFECPDLVIAFPGHRGTTDMIERARRAKIEVRKMNHICAKAMET